MLEEILKAMFGEENVQKVLVEHKPPTQPEGYESLITPEEYEALVHVFNAMDSFHKTRNNILDHRKQEEWNNASPHAKLQYLYFSDMVDEVSDKLCSLYTIHLIDKEQIEGSIKDDNMTLEEAVEKVEQRTRNKKAEDILNLILSL